MWCWLEKPTGVGAGHKGASFPRPRERRAARGSIWVHMKFYVLGGWEVFSGDFVRGLAKPVTIPGPG